MRIRIARAFADNVRADLQRLHPIAAERVGFLYGRVSRHEREDLTIITDYLPVADADYVDDPTAGATIGGTAIRSALQRALSGKECVFHTHMHESGWRQFSPIDSKTIRELSPTFYVVAPKQVHGGVVFTRSSAIAKIWNHASHELVTIPLTIVGNPMHFADAWSSK